MSNHAISVENLGKSYQLGEYDKFYDLRDAITDTLKFPFRYFSKNGKPNPTAKNSKNIWSLRDITFEVNHGDIVGIIGRNGAGKSTLLKLLSRITPPTEGIIKLNGRVGSLLEVGTGFHPELTGRENIFLNGSILGMSKKEIERKFDEIVDFAEIEKFLDTPVKRYSSGMYVRLAFAVAAHLEPEILLVDEVLAVGDLEFQKKCLGKMDNVSKEGRTILFVSHNLESISKLCKNTVVLDKGTKKFEGNTQQSIEEYLKLIDNKGSGISKTNILYENNINHDKDINIKSIEVLDWNQNPKITISSWDDFILRTNFYSNGIVENAIFQLEIKSKFGTTLVYASTEYQKNFFFDIEKGLNNIDFKIKKLQLSAGDYFLGVGLKSQDNKNLLSLDEITHFRVSEKDVYMCGKPPKYNKSILALDFKWIK